MTKLSGSIPDEMVLYKKSVVAFEERNKMLVPKFNIGDKCVLADVSYKRKSIQCPDCLGQKLWWVRAPSGEEWTVDCNTCRAGWCATGEVYEYGDTATYKILTVGSVRTDTADKSHPISYMMLETGVGTGNVYYEKYLFKTFAEAEAWGEEELKRVAGVRQAEELKDRERKKKDTVFK